MNPLTPTEAQNLQTLANIMIPTSATYKIPNTNNNLILTDILKNLNHNTNNVHIALKQLTTLNNNTFTNLAPNRHHDVATTFKQQNNTPLLTLNHIILLYYYHNDHVMHSLNQKPRSPFPKKHVIKQKN